MNVLLILGIYIINCYIGQNVYYKMNYSCNMQNIQVVKFYKNKKTFIIKTLEAIL